MVDIYLVRHGQAASHWGENLDPPLSDLGKQQAQNCSLKLKTHIQKSNNLENIQLISSPIKRAHETAKYFSSACQKNIIIAKEVSEMPTPSIDLNDRSAWLMAIMKDSWPNLSPFFNDWRNECINFISGLDKPSVIFSHYMLINIIIGHCLNNENVINYRPDNCSIHHFDNNKALSIVTLGKEANTKVN